MKFKLLNILFAIGIVSPSIAQPVLTATGITPLYRETFEIVQSIGFTNPGSSGVNILWDFSNLDSMQSFIMTIDTMAYDSYSSYFPDANCPMVNGSHVYLKTSGTELNDYGFAFDDFNYESHVNVFSDPARMLEFPFQLNDHFSDFHQSACPKGNIASIVNTFYGPTVGWFSLNGPVGYENYTHFGTRNVWADGWGTLITPAGTFPNVLRVHYTDDNQDNSTSFPSRNYTVEGYAWFMNGVHYPLMHTVNILGINEPTGIVTDYLYNVNVLTTVKEEQPDSFSFYPNPAKDKITVQGLSVMPGEAATIFIINTLGEVLSQSAISHLPSSIDVSSLSPGIYFLQLKGESGSVVKRFVKE